MAALHFLSLAAITVYRFTITPTIDEGGGGAMSAAVDGAASPPLKQVGAEEEALKGSTTDKV